MTNGLVEFHNGNRALLVDAVGAGGGSTAFAGATGIVSTNHDVNLQGDSTITFEKDSGSVVEPRSSQRPSTRAKKRGSRASRSSSNGM